MTRLWGPAAVGSAAVSLWLIACGDEASPVSTGPRVPAAVEIVAVAPVGGPIWKPGADACVEIGRDPDRTVQVLLFVEGFTLRPPGTCGSRPYCGTVILRVDPVGDDAELHRLEAAQTTLPVPFVELPLGSHTFHVELRDKRGVYVQDQDGGTGRLFAEVTLDVKSAGGCGGPIDAGSDAMEAGDAADAAVDAADATVDAADGATDAADGVVEDASAADAADAAADAPDSAEDGADGGGDGADAAMDAVDA